MRDYPRIQDKIHKAIRDNGGAIKHHVMDDYLGMIKEHFDREAGHVVHNLDQEIIIIKDVKAE